MILTLMICGWTWAARDKTSKSVEKKCHVCFTLYRRARGVYIHFSSQDASPRHFIKF